jgi:hypothetical protein
VRAIKLSPHELRTFSVPHVFCLLGERQYLLGLGSVMVATDLRVGITVRETPDEFQLDVDMGEMGGESIRDMIGRWRAALTEVLPDQSQLEGLHLTLSFSDPDMRCPCEARLSSPAVAVALATALRAHRGTAESMEEAALAELAGSLLEKVISEGRPYPQRYDALCRACIRGGAAYVAPSAEPLNAQLLVPPESLILVFDPRAASPAETPAWETHLLSGLQTLGGIEDLLRKTEKEGIAALFEMAGEDLSDQEIAILYALLRVRQMIQQLMETLDRKVRDNDRLGEVCDEESSILTDYFGFPAERLRQVRNQAVQAGALGAKFTYSFGDRPALLALAPGRRDEVAEALQEEWGQDCVRPLNLDAAGIRSEMG